MLPGLQASAVAGLERALAPKIAMSPTVSKLLTRLTDKGPGEIPWTLSVPRSGALGGIRTHDLSLRRAALYPAELQAHCAVARSAGCETDR